ncbi:MAG TPA: PQQ-dependent sugar dehydrogenase [Actinomycetota bacterium]
MARARTLATAAVLLATAGAVVVSSSVGARAGGPAVQVVARGLDFPTNFAFAPDGRIFFNEKETGRVRIIQNGSLLARPFVTLAALGGGERGMLGLALAPDFPADPWVYVYYTNRLTGRNELARIRARGDRGTTVQRLFTFLPATSGIHNGGDIAFGPDGKLYVVLGETGDESLAQNRNSLGGKVIRLNADGSVPSDNPYGATNPVWSYGHRNSFGLCVDSADGQLWETENGPTSDDEVNHILRGRNYGWPLHLGAGGAPQFQPPALVFPQVIVPTGCAFWSQRRGATPVMWFGDYHGTLHRTSPLPGGRLANHDVLSAGNGITDVEVGPDGNLYFSTTNSIERILATGPPSTPGASAPPPLPGPVGSVPVTVPTVAAPSGGSHAAAIGIGAGAAIVAGLAAWATVVARRRRRRGAPPPGTPTRSPPATPSGA